MRTLLLSLLLLAAIIAEAQITFSEPEILFEGEWEFADLDSDGLLDAYQRNDDGFMWRKNEAPNGFAAEQVLFSNSEASTFALRKRFDTGLYDILSNRKPRVV